MILAILLWVAYTDKISVFEPISGVINKPKEYTVDIPQRFRKELDNYDLSFDFEINNTMGISLTSGNKNWTINSNNEQQLGLTISKLLVKAFEYTLIMTPEQEYTNYTVLPYLSIQKERILVTNQVEIGYMAMNDQISYIILMQQYDSGQYRVQIEFLSGNGKVAMKKCMKNEVEVVAAKSEEQYLKEAQIDNYYKCEIRASDFTNNQTEFEQSQWYVEFTYHNLSCTKGVSKFNSELNPSRCAYTVAVVSDSEVQYKLQLIKLSSNQLVSDLLVNTVKTFIVQVGESIIQIQNGVDDIFIYSDQIIEATLSNSLNTWKQSGQVLFISRFDQSYLKNTTYQLKILDCPTKSLRLQYINSLVKLYINQSINILQQANTYQFYKIETQLPQVIVNIFPHNTDLQYSAFISTNPTIMFPSQIANDMEMIESNFKHVVVLDNHVYLAIKTKQQQLNYTLTILDNVLDKLELYNQTHIPICQCCSKELQYTPLINQTTYIEIESENVDSVQLTLTLDKISFIKPIAIIKKSKYLSIQYNLSAEFTYIAVINSKLQQIIQIQASQVNKIRLDTNEILSQSVQSQQYEILGKQNNTLYFYIYPFHEQLIKISNSLHQVMIQAKNNVYYTVINQTGPVDFSVNLYNGFNTNVVTLQYAETDIEQHLYKWIFNEQMNISLLNNTLMIRQQILNCSSDCQYIVKKIESAKFTISVSQSMIDVIKFNDSSIESLIQHQYLVKNYESIQSIIQLPNNSYGKYYVQIKCEFYIGGQTQIHLSNVASIEIPNQNSTYLFIILGVIMILVCAFITRRYRIIIEQKQHKRQMYPQEEEINSINEFI